MADLSITAANVAPGANARKETVTAGATITAGTPVYKDTADNDEYKASDADAAGTADSDGIALTGSSDGQPLVIQKSGGSINLGATLVVGQVYVVSTTAGGIAPYADLLSGDYVTILGVATSTSLLKLTIINSETAKP